jgi:hypothetical protein
MAAQRRNPAWVLGLASVLVIAIVASLVAFLRGGAPAAPIETRASKDASPIARDVAADAPAPSEPVVRESAISETKAATEPIAWSFDVVDKNAAAIAGAELVRGDRVLARSDSQGRIGVSARSLDVENTPRGIVWSVRHAHYRTQTLDAARIGRIERIVLADPWALVVHVRDADGSPLAGAACMLYEQRSRYERAEIARQETTAEGSAGFSDVVTNATVLRVRLNGFEPYERPLRANIESDREITVVLAKGVDFTVRVADSHQKRIANARVEAEYTRVSDSDVAPAVWDERTDEHGVAVLADFPRIGRSMQLHVTADGFAPAFESVPMNEGFAKTGVDVVLTPVGNLHVRVHEADGTQRAANLVVYYSGAAFGGHAGVPVKPAPGGVIGEYIVEVRPGVELRLVARMSGTCVAFASGLTLQEGETREVDLVVAHHVAVDVHATSPDGTCGASNTITLTSIDGHREVAAFPLSEGTTASTLQYSAHLDTDCRARILVQPGAYRVAWIRAGSASIVRDVTIVDAQTIELATDAERTLSGVLHDAKNTPLAGWTIVAHEIGGRARYSSRTAVDGRFTMSGVMASKVEMLATMPEYELTVLAADSIDAPASNVELKVALFEVELHTLSREDGSKLGARVRVTPLAHAIAQPAERATDDDGLLHLELPVGQWRISATSGDHDRIGSAVVSVTSGGSVSVTVFLRKLRHRTFTVSGTGEADHIRWLTLEGPDTAEGSLTIASLIDPNGIDTDLPDGRARFDLTKDGDVVGESIEVRVASDGPIALKW